VKVYFLICVFNLSGTDDADGDVLLALAVRQVVHGLRFTPAGLGRVAPLLHLQPDADDDGGATQQQHEEELSFPLRFVDINFALWIFT